jgi:hypothetical protein
MDAGFDRRSRFRSRVWVRALRMLLLHFSSLVTTRINRLWKRFIKTRDGIKACVAIHAAIGTCTNGTQNIFFE